MAVQVKVLDQPFIGLPKELGERFHIADGEEVVVNSGEDELRLHKLSGIQKYRGIWQDEDVDTIFSDIRGEWKRWKREGSA